MVTHFRAPQFQSNDVHQYRHVTATYLHSEGKAFICPYPEHFTPYGYYLITQGTWGVYKYVEIIRFFAPENHWKSILLVEFRSWFFPDIHLWLVSLALKKLWQKTQRIHISNCILLNRIHSSNKAIIWRDFNLHNEIWSRNDNFFNQQWIGIDWTELVPNELFTTSSRWYSITSGWLRSWLKQLIQ